MLGLFQGKKFIIIVVHEAQAIETMMRVLFTRSSATVKSTVHSSCLVGVLYDISQQTTANQKLLRNWTLKLPNSAK